MYNFFLCQNRAFNVYLLNIDGVVIFPFTIEQKTSEAICIIFTQCFQSKMTWCHRFYVFSYLFVIPNIEFRMISAGRRKFDFFVCFTKKQVMFLHAELYLIWRILKKFSELSRKVVNCGRIKIAESFYFYSHSHYLPVFRYFFMYSISYH